LGPEGGLSQAHEPLTGGASRGSSSGPSPDIIHTDRPRPGWRRHAGQPYHQALGQQRGDRPELEHGGAYVNRDVADGHDPSKAEEHAARAGEEDNTNSNTNTNPGADTNPIADHLANAAAYLPDPDTDTHTGADTNSIADHLANAAAYLPNPDTDPRANPDTYAGAHSDAYTGAHSDAHTGAHSDAHTGADAYPHACTRDRAFNSSAELLFGTDPLDRAG